MAGTRNGGMGMRKRGQSGKKQKSPKARHAMARDAAKNERVPQVSTCTASSMSELINK